MSELIDKENEISLECLEIARDSLLVNMRFLDVALLKLPFVARRGLGGIATDTTALYYDPRVIISLAKQDQRLVARSILHSLLHCVFNHAFDYGSHRQHFWDLACDIAIENMIMELELSAVSLEDDDTRKSRLRGLKKNVRDLTAQKIYRHFLINDLSADDDEEYTRLFTKDLHIYFGEQEIIEIGDNEWKKISERLKTDLKTFSKGAGNHESLIKNLMEATKDKCDLSDVIKRFTEMGEETTINDDEFDYIYYSYGMKMYGNIPLVEPLEYKDVKKVKDFAIVIDTSASCRGNIVKAFLKHTYNIMKSTENFFSTINVHIIQCDNEIQSDVKIADQNDFDEFIKNGRLKGFGGTDFRPAFEYVDKLIEEKEFASFKGLIYFTDGYGIYPEKAPDYDAMFVFFGEDDRRAKPPWWAIKVEIEEEDLTRSNG